MSVSVYARFCVSVCSVCVLHCGYGCTCVREVRVFVKKVGGKRGGWVGGVEEKEGGVVNNSTSSRSTLSSLAVISNRLQIPD